jgi:tripartite-type tricarboxylate transporter receptor subunit TctC
MMKKMLVAVCLGWGIVLAATVIYAQPYPNKAIRFVVPFPPGGGTDIVARTVTTKLSEALGVPVVVDNRGGAGGTIGTELVARAAPDGYTLVLVSGSHVINPSIYQKLPYDSLRDFSPITLLVSAPGVLVVNPLVPAKNVQELIQLAKSKPGQLNYASAGSGTPPHLAAELFKAMAGVDIIHVPYKGNAQALTDVLGGYVSLTFPTMPSALPHVKNGKLRALGVTSAQRSRSAPEIPTIAESGVPGYEASSWYGVLAPASTPPAIVNKLHDAILNLLQLQDVKERLFGQGLEPSGETPEQFTKRIEREIQKWSKVVKATDARVN